MLMVFGCCGPALEKKKICTSELDGESVRFEVDEGGDHGSARDASFRVELRHAQRRPAHAHGDSRLVPFILQKAGDPVADFPALDFLLLVLVGEEVQRGSGQGLLVRQQLLKHRLGVEDLQHWRMARGRHNLDIELDLDERAIHWNWSSRTSSDGFTCGKSPLQLMNFECLVFDARLRPPNQSGIYHPFL